MNKEFDCVQMARSIKSEIDREIRSMSASQILDYLRDSSSHPIWKSSSGKNEVHNNGV
ncbi:MAG: hypothetical protein FWC26_03685 [Fibromonadales bacterium]|nr:hypothetical protein [Fibromonadales bacterium]